MHETCKCKCRLDGNVYNNKQRWNNDKCKCECKELIDKEKCDGGLIRNPSNCECDCDNLCDIEQYLDYKNCRCRKDLVSTLVEQCTANIGENKLIYNTTLNNYTKLYNPSTIHIILLVIYFIKIISFSSAFIYFHWYLKKIVLILKRQFIKYTGGKYQAN